MKGGLVLVLAALNWLFENGLPCPTMEFVVVGDEEDKNIAAALCRGIEDGVRLPAYLNVEDPAVDLWYHGRAAYGPASPPPAFRHTPGPNP